MSRTKGILLTVIVLALALASLPHGALAGHDGGPDLEVADVVPDVQPPARDDDPHLVATIQNNASQLHTESFTVVFRIDGAYFDQENLTLASDQMPIEADAEITVTSSKIWNTTVGTHEINASLAAGGSSSEDNPSFDPYNDNHRDNNGANATLTLGPDLEPTAIEPNKKNPNEGQKVRFSVTVTNHGPWNTTDPSTVLVSLNGTPRVQATLDPLEPGEEATVETGPWTAEPGTHQVEASVNPTGQLPEPDRTNNVLDGGTIDVQRTDPNLAPQAISLDPPHPTDGDTVEVHVTVRNTGDEAAPASTTELSIGGEEITPANDTDALDPGAQATARWTWEASIGAHDFLAVVDANAAIPESDEDDNRLEETILVGPDLTVTELRLSPEEPVTGDPVTAEVDVANLAETVQANITVALLVDGQAIAQQTLDGLSRDAEETLTFGPINATAGEHTIAAVIDADEAIEEARESNNRATASLSVGKGLPDLTVTETRLSRSQVSPGEALSFAAFFANDGGTTAENVTVRFVIDDETLGSPIQIGTLAPGEVANATSVNWTAGRGGHTLTVEIDPGEDGGEIREEDEDNNVASLPFSIGPDLIPVQVSLDPAAPRIGENVTVTTRVYNQGTEPTGDFQVRLAADGDAIGDAPADGLDPLEETTVEHAWRASDVGSLRVTVDALEQVDEVGGENNVLEVNVSVNTSVPNLVAGDLVPEPAEPGPGTNVTFTLNVTNDGATDAGSFDVVFRVNGSLIGTTSVTDLAAGASASVTSDPWTAELGATDVTARIDPTDAVAESDTSDNVATLSIDVQEDESGLPAPGALLVGGLLAGIAAAARRER